MTMTKGDLIKARSIIQVVIGALYKTEIDRRAAACSLEIAMNYLDATDNDSSESCDLCRGHAATCPNLEPDRRIPMCVDDF